MWFSKTVRTKIKRQLKGNIRLGGFVDTLAFTMFWMSLVNFLMMAVTTYTVTREYTISIFPWFSIWIFLATLGLIIATVMVFEYKLVYPSRVAFRNQQEYAHESPIKEDLKQIKDNQERLRIDIIRIREELGIGD
jgi:predicted membrane protein